MTDDERAAADRYRQHLKAVESEPSDSPYYALLLKGTSRAEIERDQRILAQAYLRLTAPNPPTSELVAGLREFIDRIRDHRMMTRPDDESTKGLIKFLASAAAALERMERHTDALEAVLRHLASYLGAGGYNADTVDPERFKAKVLDGIEMAVVGRTRLLADQVERMERERTRITGHAELILAKWLHEDEPERQAREILALLGHGDAKENRVESGVMKLSRERTSHV